MPREKKRLEVIEAHRQLGVKLGVLCTAHISIVGVMIREANRECEVPWSAGCLRCFSGNTKLGDAIHEGKRRLGFARPRRELLRPRRVGREPQKNVALKHASEV